MIRSSRDARGEVETGGKIAESEYEVKATQPELGRRLRELRRARQLSQRALASDMVTPSYISLLESGERVPTLDVVLHLASVLGVHPSELVGGENRDLFTASVPDAGQVVATLRTRDLLSMGDVGSARQLLEAQLARSRESGSPGDLLETGIQLGQLLTGPAEHEARMALLDELVEVAVANGLDDVVRSLSIDRVSALRDLGRLDQGRREAERLLAAADELSSSDRVRLLGVLVSVLVESGEMEPVEGLVTQLVDEAETTGQPALLGRAHWVAGMALARLGRASDAVRHIDLAESGLRFGALSVLEWLRFCRSTAAILLDSGDPEAALSWLRSAETAAAAVDLRAEQRAVQRVRAQYELSTGDANAAARLYEELLDAGSDDTPALAGLSLISVLTGYADALAELGRTEEMSEVLRQAALLYEESGSFRQAAMLWRRRDERRSPP